MMDTAGHPEVRSDMAAMHLTIVGQVQGVGFRWAMSEAAEALGVRGWVRNRTDGAVEAVAIGPATAVAGLRDWARHGPSGARVDRVIERAALDSEVALAGSGFASLPTA